MTKYIITDPCYLLDDDTWQKCCDAAKLPSGNWSDDIFNAYVADALKMLSGSEAWASETGFGDWSNSIQGTGTILQNEFAADSGMVCVCELNDKVEASMHDKYPTGLGHCAAIIECTGPVKVEFNKDDSNWTVLYIRDSANNAFRSEEDDVENYFEDDDE